MAQIKMDVSEYEAMKENKRLLEQSLEKERQLQSEIEKLNKEKIKALEEAKMKVVKISKTEKHEHVFVKRNDNDIWARILQMLNVNSLSPPPPYFRTERIVDEFFEKITSVSPLEESITTHGLDDVKKELRDEIEQQVQDKLNNAEQTFKEYNELRSENIDLRKENERLEDENKELLKRFKGAVDKIGLHESNSYLLGEIHDVLQEKRTFWNSKKILNKIVEVIKGK